MAAAGKVASGFFARGLWYRAPLRSPRTWSTCHQLRPRAYFSSPARRQSPPRSNAPGQKQLQARAASPLVLVVALLGGAGYYLLSPPARPTTLNDQTFVPYSITSREAISPTSFVITIVPNTPNPSLPYIKDPLPSSSSSSSPDTGHSPAQWRHPLWSVEFKQPEVQISRHYTPLPPLTSEDPADGALHFYIRAVGDGEMSHYLARRQVGQDVWLRGPHAGFELAERLGSRTRVVFLAGGTGVAPGMQAAKAVLDARQDTVVDLLWAVRKREEVQAVAAPPAPSSWKFWEGKKPVGLGRDIERPSPVARRLADMKTAYGERLRIQVVVDEEGTRFREADIKKTLAASTPATALDQSSGSASSTGCQLHDQKMHCRASETALPDGTSCVCTPGGHGAAGKNLFIVSGPDGFVEHYAGTKIWSGGQQIQGPVGGVVAQLQRQEPQLAKDWLVLKM